MMALPGDGAASSPPSGERTAEMVISRRAGASIANGAIVLILVQALGALLIIGFERFLKPMAVPPLLIRSFVILVLASGFCFIARPGLGAMGLRAPAKGFLPMAGTALAACIWTAVFSVSAYFGIEVFCEKAFAGLLVPFAEESLFRGFIWGIIEEAWEKSDGEGGRRSGTAVAFIATTLLFTAWSIGMSLISGGFGALQDGRLAMKLCTRALVGLGVGIVAGAARAGTKSAWMPFFLHGIYTILAH
jgi:membrane protease YdiL (CAAX protease family)